MNNKNASPYTMSVVDIKKMCQIIECTGTDPDMCRDRPFNCGIIRKIFGEANRKSITGERETSQMKNELFEAWMEKTYKFRFPDTCPAFSVPDLEAAWNASRKEKEVIRCSCWRCSGLESDPYADELET